ncbi:MAG: hypothetical protein KGH55_01445 [Nanoarchaeota archaeon]|nr:hypothetical protein [Nanoarchaeota archaeon]
MENKHVGFLILGISALIVVIIFLFQGALIQIANSGCSMEKTACPMYTTIDTQTYLALSIVGILFILGLILIFAKPKERIIVKKVKEKSRKIDLEKLDKDERKVVELLLQEGKAMFQSSLMEKLEIGKVGMTRLLDKLEAKQIIERKRRGMNNIVVLKD